MIIVFCRSRELNGIGEIARSLPKLDSDFLVIKSAWTLCFFLLTRGKGVDAIFSLSSSDFLIAAGIMNLLRKRIKHVMGVYHPKQWAVMLDRRYSKTRSRVFRRLMNGFPAGNIVFNTQSAKEASVELIEIGQGAGVIVAPSVTPVADKFYSPVGRDGCVEIVTVGRFVDFKVSSVIQMIRAVGKINEESPGRLRYVIYGDGPCVDQIYQEISHGKCPGVVEVRGSVPRESFASVVSCAQIFFGMGFAVVHAAMLGVPSLIAIQDEVGPNCYGWFANYDHSLSPMFGDVSPSGITVSIESAIKEFISLDHLERNRLASSCALAAKPYRGEKVVSELKEFLLNSSCVSSSVSLLDLLRVRIETFASRIFGVYGIQA